MNGDGMVHIVLCETKHHDVDKRIDSLESRLNGFCDKAEKKLDGMKNLMLSLAGGLILNLILMIAGMLRK